MDEGIIVADAEDQDALMDEYAARVSAIVSEFMDSDEERSHLDALELLQTVEWNLMESLIEWEYTH